MASSPDVNPTSAVKKKLSSELYLKTLLIETGMCETSKFIETYSADLPLAQKQNVLEEIKLVCEMTEKFA